MSYLKIVKAFPRMPDQFRPNKNAQIRFRKTVLLLKPNFAEDGLNKLLYQNKVYNIFVKYLREAGDIFLLLVDVFETSFPFLYPSENIRKPVVS